MKRLVSIIVTLYLRSIRAEEIRFAEFRTNKYDAAMLHIQRQFHIICPPNEKSLVDNDKKAETNESAEEKYETQEISRDENLFMNWSIINQSNAENINHPESVPSSLSLNSEDDLQVLNLYLTEEYEQYRKKIDHPENEKDLLSLEYINERMGPNPLWYDNEIQGAITEDETQKEKKKNKQLGS